MTLDQKPSPSNDPLTAATVALSETPIPSGPPAELLARVDAIPTDMPRIRIAHFPWRLVAACVAVLLTGSMVWILMSRSGGSAFAQAVQAINQTRTFTATVNAPPEVRISAKGRSMRFDSSGMTVIVNPDQGRVLQLATLTRQATTRPFMGYQAEAMNLDLYSMLRDYRTGSEKALGEKQIDGRRVLGFRLTRPAQPGLAWTFWIDPDTRLPIQIEAGPAVFKDLRFDVALDDSLFDPAVPAGYVLAAPAEAAPQFRYSGQVVDERGRPVANAMIRPSVLHALGGTRYHNEVKTNADGRFSVTAVSPAGSRVRLTVSHADFVDDQLDDVHLLPVEQHAQLILRLRDGKAIVGTVTDSVGKPVAGALVQVSAAEEDRTYKTALTDADGKFALRGLPTEATGVRVRAKDATSRMLVGHATVGLRSTTQPAASPAIVIRPFELPPGKSAHSLFGMKLVDVDDEMQKNMVLYPSDRVMILDPGPEIDRLDIANPQQGDAFWMVGDTRISNFHDFAWRLLAACEEQARAGKTRFSVRVVYNFTRADESGSNTQYMTLHANDLEELRKLVAP